MEIYVYVISFFIKTLCKKINMTYSEITQKPDNCIFIYIYVLQPDFYKSLKIISKIVEI